MRTRLQDREQIFSVAAGAHSASELGELCLAYVTHAVCGFLGRADLQTLTGFHHSNEVRRGKESLVCSGIEPRHSSPKRLDLERAGIEILPVHVGNLDFSP